MSRRRNSDADEGVTYGEIMTRGSDKGTTEDAAKSLSSRLVTFRKWLNQEAKATVHPAICIVNGEATDGTRNAPVLVIGPPPDGKSSTTATGRVGVVDGATDQAMYDRTMGCHLRAVREIKKDETIITMPRGAMITPDLIASSDAGKAILACCKAPPGVVGFWDAFENTTIRESTLSNKVSRNNGPQILVKVLQERRKAEAAFKKHSEDSGSDYTLVEPNTISTRAPLLAFLIHQRFSNSERPPVSELGFGENKNALDGNALGRASGILVPPGAPGTFAPYARTLPSSVSTPLCWNRRELALLTGCLPGLGILQRVASDTLLLASEFIALLNAGLLTRFPKVFPEGVITWERWLWAAAVTASRMLPASAYLDDGVDANSFKPVNPLEFQSPPDIWKELGVFVPLLDMLNHEIEAHQVSWKPCIPAPLSGHNHNDEMQDEAPKPHPPLAILHKKARKGTELFTCYGDLCNTDLITQYGFALMNNTAEVVRLAWGLADGVGNVKPPHDYTPPFESSDDFVFESNDERAVNEWWSEDRLLLLKQEAVSRDESTVSLLVSGKKLTTEAFNDGTYDPILLSAAVVATMPRKSLSKNVNRKEGSKIVLSKRHLVILGRYLEFWFSRKLEKLLQMIDNGLKEYYPGTNLWTKSSEGGLEFEDQSDGGDSTGVPYSSWQSFFDSHAYRAAIEVEKHYYAMGSDSCVLTLYDCQLRTLQAGASQLSADGKLSEDILKQLKDIDFEIEDKEASDKGEKMEEDAPTVKSPARESGEAQKNGKDTNGSRSPRSRKRNKKSKTAGNGTTAGRPPALKLHVGNLSYKTTPSDLYDYFRSLYGEDNVLECHIPMERESGRSRGFGFVAMPEEVAQRVLQSGKKHEVGGRIVKIAKSNSVGSGSGNKASGSSSAPVSSDRCATCGYRPRYCTCAKPNVPGFDGSPGPNEPGYDRPGDYGRSSRSHGYSRSHERHRDERYDRYGRRDDYDIDRRSHRYGDSSSRSYERIDDRRGHRERERSRDRSLGRRRDYDDERRFRDERRRDRSWDRDRRRSRSRSRSRERSRSKKKSKRRKSRSRSGSP